MSEYIFKPIEILNLSDLIYELYVLNHDFSHHTQTQVIYVGLGVSMRL